MVSDKGLDVVPLQRVARVLDVKELLDTIVSKRGVCDRRSEGATAAEGVVGFIVRIRPASPSKRRQRITIATRVRQPARRGRRAAVAVRAGAGDRQWPAVAGARLKLEEAVTGLNASGLVSRAGVSRPLQWLA